MVSKGGATMEIILELINEKKYSEAREELLKLNSVDIATLLEEVDNKKIC